MTILVKALQTFDLYQIEGVTNIAYSTGTYSITNEDGTVTYDADDYNIYII